MQLTKMRLTGFKSFVEATEFSIEEGITGIVGPNGCGKSNVVDALRWGMGETSAKQLRGGEMDDVIFGGTADRPSRNLAEVILCLNNAARRAPPQFNDADELFVSRQIERGHGSNYTINGIEVRARDVQTLFADGSTGARSTSMVSQGSIGSIVNAQPQQRRGVLEEAAGITGLHARRHEAELRLRGAETNLERLDDVIIALQEQHRLLKKQARQANRYKNLSGHIKRHEAIFFHLQWIQRQSEKQLSTDQLLEVEKQVTELTKDVAEATRIHADVSHKLPNLRQHEIDASAALQRLLVSRNTLDAEEQRVELQSNEIRNRLNQINNDVEREKILSSDAAAAIIKLNEESENLEFEQENNENDFSELEQKLRTIDVEVQEYEKVIAQNSRSVVEDETSISSLQNQILEGKNKKQKLDKRLLELESQERELTTIFNNHDKLDSAHLIAEEARRKSDDAREKLLLAEKNTAAARNEEKKARSEFRQTEATSAKLKAEQDALSELLEVVDPELWPPMIDTVDVEPGYEVALGAALGDDLVAPADEASPVHWRELRTNNGASVLPDNAIKLSNFVRGPKRLMSRLEQIGVVGSSKEGDQLQDQLRQGQRLVSRAGALWRWDGFTAAVGAPTGAASRLAQRNRLEEVRVTLASAENNTKGAHSIVQKTAGKVEREVEQERLLREEVWKTDRVAMETRETYSTLSENAAHSKSRLNSIRESIKNINLDIADLIDIENKAELRLSEITDISGKIESVEQMQKELTSKRETLAQVRSSYDQFSQQTTNRSKRLQEIASDLQSWKTRADNADKQINEFLKRQIEETAELQRLSCRPDEIAAERNKLLDQISDAEIYCKNATDRLATDETLLEKLSGELRNCETLLATAREDRVRRESIVEQNTQKLLALSDKIFEKLQCQPENLLETVGINEIAELPPEEEVQTKLERLQRERDNMGPVNLLAEKELKDLEEKVEGMEAEKQDLQAAIVRLRQGITSLNREGRERLLAAFSEVNQHFQNLFSRLFGGGRAHIKLTEADDPLEAGLEIFASPPGKRLQKISLLSGGEQTLTALGLLFSVFLTNPAPICVLDEVDAALDDSNVDRFCSLLEEISKISHTRFVVVTHHRHTMARVDRLYGVTMSERGVSELVSVNLEQASDLRETA